MEHLATDPEAEYRFSSDPEGEMTSYGLTDAQQHTVRWGSPADIRATLDTPPGPFIIRRKPVPWGG
jgi:hypothetical protein